MNVGAVVRPGELVGVRAVVAHGWGMEDGGMTANTVLGVAGNRDTNDEFCHGSAYARGVDSGRRLADGRRERTDRLG